MITVLVADDHAMVREGIVRMLDDAADITVLDQVCSGEEAISFCRKHRPDVVIMDVRMPGIGGLEATRKLLQVAPDSHIIALSACDQEPLPSRLLKAGAAAYLTKGASEQEMLTAVRQVAAGKRYLSPGIAQAMALQGFDGEGSPFDSLSEREMQISMMVATCHKVQDIAERLNISAKTVNSYRYRVFEKLDVNGDVELTLLAIRHGLIDSPLNQGGQPSFMTEPVNNDTPQFDAKRFLSNVTRKTGVYVMLDAAGDVLYVGKAKNLRNRLSSYFRASGLTSKTMALVSRIAQIEVTVTASEGEALLLEQNLIKENKPPYNILLRDDKSYPYIYLSDHRHPRLSLHRGSKRGKGQYFGPYPSASAVRESLNWLQKVFKVRQCEDSYYRNRSRPCLQYQIGRCTGPCVNMVSDDDYQRDVHHTALFLQGKNSDLLAEMADDMEAHAANLEFEKAAELRDRITYLQQVQANQCIEGESGDLDIVAGVLNAGVCCIQLLYVRKGRVLGSRSYFPKSRLEEGVESHVEAFLAQHYLTGSGAMEIPREVIVNVELPDATLLAGGLSERAGRQVAVSHRVRSHRAKWLNLAVTAAEQNLRNRLAASESMLGRYQALADALELNDPPQRLECFDISHSSGEATVASCVVFDSNGPLKSDYRRMNIDDVAAADDYAAMRQALTRRYKRVTAGEIPMPDVLFIDGGKGQLNQAKDVMAELGVDNLLMVGVAKGADRRAGLEVLIRSDDGREVTLPDNNPALHLIQHIRDESHRFAVTGHKARRDKARRTSGLEAIPGVGAKRRRELLRHFGGLQGVKAASIGDLSRVPGISDKLARDIYEGLRSEQRLNHLYRQLQRVSKIAVG